MFWNSEITPGNEPAKVLLKRGEFTDSARAGRVVPFKLYYPADAQEKLPVIIWSHGFGGNRDGASFLSRFLAAQGYFIVHITHKGTDSSLWEGKQGHPWDILREIKIPRAATINRFRDVPFVLDQLPDWAKDQPELSGMDFTRTGMSGHSFGAMTTQAMAGMLYPDEQGTLLSFKEPRFRAGILYSPVPIAHITDEAPKIVYGDIDIPLLHMTGTEDVSPLESFGYDHRLLVYNNTHKAEKFALVKNGGDHMVYNGTRGKLEENPNRERHEEIVKIGALAFWDAYLKNDKAAHDWLAKGGFVTYIGADGTFKHELS